MDNYNGFPATYQPYQPNWYYQPTVTMPSYGQRTWQQQTTALPPYQQNQQQPVNNNMIWVQGESGAKSYVLPNGVTLPLWDSEAQVIYIKSVDNQGRPSMTILDYTERGAKDENKKEEEPKIEYATKEQVDGLNSQFAAINEKLNSLGSYVTKDQFDSLNGHIKDLGGQIEDIEDRLTGFSKSQQNNQNNRRGK